MKKGIILSDIIDLMVDLVCHGMFIPVARDSGLYKFVTEQVTVKRKRFLF